MSNPKEYSAIIKGVKVTAYNDSNCEWVVLTDNTTPQRFNKRKWTRKEAMAFVRRCCK